LVPNTFFNGDTTMEGVFAFTVNNSQSSLNRTIQIQLIRTSTLNRDDLSRYPTTFYVAVNRTATPKDPSAHTVFNIDVTPQFTTYYLFVERPGFLMNYNYALRYCSGSCPSPCPYDQENKVFCSGNGACDIDSNQCLCDTGVEKYGEYQITGDSCSTVEPKPGVTWIYVICLLSVVILLSSLYLLAYIFIETEHCECYQELVDEDNSLNVVDVFDDKVD